MAGCTGRAERLTLRSSPQAACAYSGTIRAPESRGVGGWQQEKGGVHGSREHFTASYTRHASHSACSTLKDDEQQNGMTRVVFRRNRALAGALLPHRTYRTCGSLTAAAAGLAPFRLPPPLAFSAPARATSQRWPSRPRRRCFVRGGHYLALPLAPSWTRVLRANMRRVCVAGAADEVCCARDCSSLLLPASSAHFWLHFSAASSRSCCLPAFRRSVAPSLCGLLPGGGVGDLAGRRARGNGGAAVTTRRLV